MPYRKRTRDEHFSNDGQPKRILALDGGGLRGIFTVGVLERMEQMLRDRHDDQNLVLSDYFDLIAGTSTGAIIAAGLAFGLDTKTIKAHYDNLGARVFEKDGLGIFRAKYDSQLLDAELKNIFGAGTTLGDPVKLKTGLLVMTKRLDTGSPWPISNNPRGKYFPDRPNGVIGNCRYNLAEVVRASTAAPTYFDPQEVIIATQAGKDPVVGNFVDGGVSPFNNPSLQALMYATLDGFRVCWPKGADKLLLVSVGTGSANPNVDASNIVAKAGIQALASLMEDCAALQETMMQWISTSPTARQIDREIGTLANDQLGAAPLVTYVRYNLQLMRDPINALDPQLVSTAQLKKLSDMDIPENMPTLHKLGELLAGRDLKPEHFPLRFDLPTA